MLTEIFVYCLALDVTYSNMKLWVKMIMKRNNQGNNKIPIITGNCY